jgi:hypothetical protein
MLCYCDTLPKFGPGVIYEKLRQLKLLKLVARAAVIGPESLAGKVKAVRAFVPGQVRYFNQNERDAALQWVTDTSPTVEVLPTDRSDRFCLRISGRITSVEVKSFYQALVPHLGGSNSLDVLLEIPYEDGMTVSAAFQAVKLGIKHYSQVTKGIRRLAIITDSRFLSKATEVENLLIPSVEERPFTFAQREIALAWLSEGREALPPVPTQPLPMTETKLLES